MRHPVVYRLQLVKAIDGGYYLAYAGSGGQVVVRPPESVLERIKKFGLDGNSEWDITIEWQTKYLAAASQTWTWSKGELRFVYEFAETNVINVDRPFWNGNVSNEGFHLGKSRNLLLDGLFTGIYDLATYEQRLKWLNEQNLNPRYKAALVLKLSRAALVIRLFQGSFGKNTDELQELLNTAMFEHLDAEERRDLHNKLSNAGLFAGCFGKKTQDLQKLLETDMFAHLDPTGRQNYHDCLANASLFDGFFGKKLGDLLQRLDSPEFAHLEAGKKKDLARKLRDVIFLTSCTELECMAFGEAAESEEDLQLFARAMLKFKGIGVAAGQEENPFKVALKEKYREVRPLFPAMFLTSTKENVNWAEVDLQKVRHETTGVRTWMRGLGVPLCRQRMEYCAKMDLAPDSQVLLTEFKDLFDNYTEAFAAKKRKEVNLVRAADGLPPALVGGQRGAKTVYSAKQLATLTVMYVLMQILYFVRDEYCRVLPVT
jgi:hypothetical protein